MRGPSERPMWEAKVRGLPWPPTSASHGLPLWTPRWEAHLSESPVKGQVGRPSERPKREAKVRGHGRPWEAKVGGRSGRSKWEVVGGRGRSWEAEVGGQSGRPWESEVGGRMSLKWEAM